jgi:hypothetical protein
MSTRWGKRFGRADIEFASLGKTAGLNVVLRTRSLIKKVRQVPMKRRSFRRFLKPAMLAFAVSSIFVPSAIAMPAQSVGGSGAYARATEPISTSSPGRIAPDVPPVSTSVQVVSQPNGFDWGDFGLGAAGAVLLTALVATMTLVAVRHGSSPLAHR